MSDTPITVGRRYLVVVNLRPNDPQRLAKTIPALIATLEGLSTSPVEQLLRSTYADWCAYLLRSRADARSIHQKLESPQDRKSHAFPGDADWREPFLTNADTVFVTEIGDDFSASQAFARQRTWFQRH